MDDMNDDSNRIQLIEGQHILVEENGMAVVNEKGDWLVLDTHNQSLVYVHPNEEVLNFFQVIHDNVPPSMPCSPPETDSFSQEDQGKDLSSFESPPQSPSTSNHISSCKWQRSAILQLIELYKENMELFKSSSVKNDQVWKIITEKLKENGHHYNKAQVESKFKYLKSRYTKKKDNMGGKGTGESPLLFEYFEQFDQIFGEKPTHTPLSIASSSKSPNTNEEKSEQPLKKAKPSKTENKINDWIRIFQERDNKKEQERDRRHRERLEQNQAAIQTYENLFKQMLEKL